MQEHPEDFSAQESIRLIQSMIEKAKASIGDNRFYFLLWGWLTFTAILVQFFLKVVLEYRHHYLVWFAVLPAVVITILHSRKNKKSKYVTYVGDSMNFLWTGIGISFFVLSFIITNSPSSWNNSYPFFILFYGLGTFVSGRILKFPPLVIGGIINWILACICVFVHFDYQLLVAAAAILASYIIPGHLIQSEKKLQAYA